jgi:N-acetyl-gamma-glutamyl-phosphate reductase
MSKLRAAIIGVNGYVGSELARLLLGHPHVSLVSVVSRQHAGKPLSEVLPGLCGFTDLLVDSLEGCTLGEVDVVFLATPHGVAKDLLSRVTGATKARIVDMSADHRHQEGWVYGQPEWNGEQLKDARRIAVPGCFATAIALATAPIAHANLLGGPVCVAATTGSTGSGAKAKTATHHPERAVNFKAYKVLQHQHVPEIQQFLGQWTETPQVHFVPQSGPYDRGIFATCFVPLREKVDVAALYRDAYGPAPLVRLRSSSPELRFVRGTGFCDLSVHAVDDHAVVLCAIDNLGRGAAFQGVQALNTAMGWSPQAGIWISSLTP